MRCFPSFIKINPCRGIVDDYKVRDKIGAGGYLTPALLFVSSFFDAKLSREMPAEKMLIIGGLRII
jgi:hypothetical protein